MIPRFLVLFLRRWRKKPEQCMLTLLVRPDGDGPFWWPKSNDGKEFSFVSIDPYDPPSWSMGVDPACEFDSLELWEETKSTVEEHIEALKIEWLEWREDEETDPESEEESELFQWEFELRCTNEEVQATGA